MTAKFLLTENINLNNLVQIKGFTYSLKELLQDNEIYNLYDGGTCLIFRLCPTDYHRFHFIDDGVCGGVQLKLMVIIIL